MDVTMLDVTVDEECLDHGHPSCNQSLFVTAAGQVQSLVLVCGCMWKRLWTMIHLYMPMKVEGKQQEEFVCELELDAMITVSALVCGGRGS